jgi:hypothetical protein
MDPEWLRKVIDPPHTNTTRLAPLSHHALSLEGEGWGEGVTDFFCFLPHLS